MIFFWGKGGKVAADFYSNFLYSFLGDKKTPAKLLALVT